MIPLAVARGIKDNQRLLYVFPQMSNLFEQILNCVRISDPTQKVSCAQQLNQMWTQHQLDTDSLNNPEDYVSPGRPEKPKLVPPRNLPRRSLHTKQGMAALLHSIAHIEFNAINLALDAAYRFRDLPNQYYADWIRIAAEEAYHFQLVDAHLRTLGYAYGDFSAHNGLWDMAMQTNHSALVRMAIIPRVMEARGLDVTPGIINRFAAVGEHKVVEILKIIMRDEIGHVEVGTHWFNYLCDKKQLPRQATFEKLMREFSKGRVKLPLHREARINAGFTESELKFLEGLA